MKYAATGLAMLFGFIASPARSADLPSFDSVSDGFEKVVVSDLKSQKAFFNVWRRNKDAQLLGELPKNFKTKSYFIALTLSSGDQYAGLQSGELVVKWRQYDNRLALIAPNLSIRATGDAESKASVKRLFTDRVLLDIPIVAMGPTGGPVIDLDSMLVNNASTFFGRSVRVSNSRIRNIEKVKVFPTNVEIAIETVGSGNRFQTLHYSFSEVPSTSSGFKPRKADQRVGYFTTTFSDLKQVHGRRNHGSLHQSLELAKTGFQIETQSTQRAHHILRRTHHSRTLSTLDQSRCGLLEQSVRKSRDR